MCIFFGYARSKTAFGFSSNAGAVHPYLRTASSSSGSSSGSGGGVLPTAVHVAYTLTRTGLAMNTSSGSMEARNDQGSEQDSAAGSQPQPGNTPPGAGSDLHDSGTRADADSSSGTRGIIERLEGYIRSNREATSPREEKNAHWSAGTPTPPQEPSTAGAAAATTTTSPPSPPSPAASSSESPTKSNEHSGSVRARVLTYSSLYTSDATKHARKTDVHASEAPEVSSKVKSFERKIKKASGVIGTLPKWKQEQLREQKLNEQQSHDARDARRQAEHAERSKHARHEEPPLQHGAEERTSGHGSAADAAVASAAGSASRVSVRQRAAHFTAPPKPTPPPDMQQTIAERAKRFEQPSSR